jgi:hypothetical protein
VKRHVLKNKQKLDTTLKNKIVRIKTWKEFKQLIEKHNPKSIVYNIEQGIPARNLTVLRLILPTQGVQYVFIDTAKKARLRKTRISIHKNDSGNLFIEEKDVKKFLRSQTNRENLKLHSYWTI